MTWGLLASVVLATEFGCAADSAEELDADAVVELASADDGKADHAGFQLALWRSRTITGGRATTLWFDVVNPAGDPVTRFETDHTKLFHLIVVSRDLSYFAHIHPTYRGAGRFSVNWTPPRFDDRYHLYSQFHPTGLDEGLTIRQSLTVPGSVIRTPVPLTADVTTMKTQGDDMLMIEAPRSGFTVGDATVGLMVHDASTGELANDLEPFLGARAHLVVIKANAEGRVFEHAHDMGGDAGGGHAGHGGGATMDATGMLSFDVRFPSRGLYRLWAQYRRDGRDVTQFFTVNVR